MHSKYIPRLLHYIDLGDLEKIAWCLKKDQIDLNLEYECKGQSHSFNLMCYVILHEEDIPQCEEILELFIRHGGDLYHEGSGYGTGKISTSPWEIHLERRQQQKEIDERKKNSYSVSKTIPYDQEGFIHTLFQKNPSSNFFNLQNAAQAAADRLDIEMLEMVFSLGSDPTKPPRENATFPLSKNLEYALSLKRRDDSYISDRDKELAAQGNLLLEKVILNYSIPETSRPKTSPRL